MDEQIKFYEQMIASQLQLRKTLKKDQLGNVRLLDIIDEQVTMLNEIVLGLKDLKK